MLCKRFEELDVATILTLLQCENSSLLPESVGFFLTFFFTCAIGHRICRFLSAEYRLDACKYKGMFCLINAGC